MTEVAIVKYVIQDNVELNLSYMPFIKNGGLFVPSFDRYSLGDHVMIELQLPGKKDVIKIDGKVVWITPQNSFHYVLPGIGVQFIGVNAQTTRTLIENGLERNMQIGGYTYGITDDKKK